MRIIPVGRVWRIEYAMAHEGRIFSKLSNSVGLARKQAVDDEALLNLFWNRASLKKEFAIPLDLTAGIAT